MTPEERRKIYINNLSKVKKRTGRPKKNGKRITIRFDPAVYFYMTQYTEIIRKPLDLTINEILCNFLKKHTECEVPKNYVVKIGNMFEKLNLNNYKK